MNQFNREIIAEEIYKSTFAAAGSVVVSDWVELHRTEQEKYRLQADYMLSKFRMILRDDIDDNETPPDI